MTVKCPQCGFDVVVKASIGEGTQSMRQAKKLSRNDLYIFKMFVAGVFKLPPTIREIQKAIYDMPDRNKPWNYHNVQIQVSRLLGAKVLKVCYDPKVWLKFPETKTWATDKTPRYWLAIERQSALAILAQEGRLSFPSLSP